MSEFDCQTCGACCQTSRPVGARDLHWVNCTPADVKQMPRRHRLKLVPVRTSEGERMHATPLRPDGTCAFLRGTPGDRVSCGIYDSRPTLCRRYEAGSDYCRASRREIGLPA